MPAATIAKNRLSLLLAVLALPLCATAAAAGNVVFSGPFGKLLTYDQLPAPASLLEDRVAAHEAALAEMALATGGDSTPRSPSEFVEVALDLSSAYDPEDALSAAGALTGRTDPGEVYEDLGVALLGAARQARFGQDLELARDYLLAAEHVFELADGERQISGTPVDENDYLHRAVGQLEQILVEDSLDSWRDAADLLAKQLEVTATGPRASWAQRIRNDPASYVGEEEIDLNAVVHVGGDVLRPQKIFAPRPRYTESSRKARIQGVVIIQAVIDRHGSVAAVMQLKGLPMGLGEEALRAMSTWLFEPATLDGQPVPVYYNLTVSFRL